jgi:4-hydroxy-tetrahydrodipicolinate synthase
VDRVVTTSRVKPLAGVLPVFQTPFRADETIDEAVLAREFDWLFEQGVAGVVMAMVSEVLRLSHDERKSLAAATSRLVAGRGSVTISVGAESTRVAEELARHAESVGADAVMAIPPVSVGVGEDELMRYYARITRAISIPVVVQDASAYVGRPLSIPLCVKMLDEFGERVYFKPEATPIGPRLSALRDATGGRARVFEGTGGIALVDSYRRGIVGTMPGADLVRAIVPLWQALERGDDATVYRINGPLVALVSLQNALDSFLAIEKHLLVKQGVFANTLVRGPVGYVLDDETRREVDRLFDRLMSEAAR